MSRQELGELVRALKDQLEWQSGGFASKVQANRASDLDRESFAANVRQRRERAIEMTKVSLMAEDELPTQNSSALPPPHETLVVEKEEITKPRQESKESSEVQSLWKTTGSRPSTTFQTNATNAATVPWDESDTAAVKLSKVRTLMGDCQRCGLCKERNNIVFGVGNPSARLMFIGEAPDFFEDKEGQPFLGKSGELLDKMIVAMGLKRSDVYVANTIKCRPPNNRDPKTKETQTCSPFLKLQIEAIAPDVIVTLGKFSSNILSNGTDGSDTFSSIRGHWQSFENIPLMPTFHPASLLRTPSEKRPAWADLQEVMKKLAL